MKSIPFNETRKGSLVFKLVPGGAGQIILTVDSKIPLEIEFPILQNGMTPYSGMNLNQAPSTTIYVPPSIGPP